MALNDKHLSGTDTSIAVRMKSGAGNIRQQGSIMDSSDQMLQGQNISGGNENTEQLQTTGGDDQNMEQSLTTGRDIRNVEQSLTAREDNRNIEQPQAMRGDNSLGTAVSNPILQNSGDRSRRQFAEHSSQPQTSIGQMRPVQNHRMQEIGVGAKQKYSFNPQQETGGNNTNRNYVTQESDSSHLETDAKPSLSPDETEHDDRQPPFVSQPPTFLEEARRCIYGEHDYLDVSIVYAKADYDKVDEEFIPWLKQVCRDNRVTVEPRIVLYDDDRFPPHNLESIDYIINRSMRIFIYLTQNFSEESQMKFIAQESVSNTRLANPNEAAKFVMSQRKWAVRPVHTKNENERKYKTPTGLNSVYGIDFFSKNSKHTRNKTCKLVQDAIDDRIRREWEERQKESQHYSSNSRDSYGGEAENRNLQNSQNQRTVLSVSNSSSSRGHNSYSGDSAQIMQSGPNGIEDKNSRVFCQDRTYSIIDQPRHSDYQTKPETVLHKTRNIGTEEPSISGSMSSTSINQESTTSAINDCQSENIPVCASGDDCTNMVTGHSPAQSNSKFTQNYSSLVDSTNTSMVDGRGREEVKAEEVISNRDAINPQPQESIGCQESSAQETMTNSELANNDSNTGINTQVSLEIDAQPSTGFNYGETLTKQKKEMKLEKHGKNFFDVIENVQTYHGLPERQVAPCASAPPDNTGNSISQDTLTHERGDDNSSQSASGGVTNSHTIEVGAKRKIDSAVQADPISNFYQSAKNSGGRVVEVHHHYYGERHHHPKQHHKRSQEPQINITGCAVVQIGNQATVANSAVTASTKIPSEGNKIDNDQEFKETPSTARKVLTSLSDDSVSEDNMPSDISQDTPLDQSLDKSVNKSGSEDGVQEPRSDATSPQTSNTESWNIFSPEADRTTSTEDLRSTSLSAYAGINGDSYQGELSDEDNSRQSTSYDDNDTTETKDVLDDMLQTSPSIECPTDWTPVKQGVGSTLDTSTTRDLNQPHFTPEGNSQRKERDEGITETVVEYTEPITPADSEDCESSMATSTPVIANKTSSTTCLAMVCDKENKDNTQLECSKCDKNPCKRQPLVIDTTSNQLKTSRSNIAISYCNELETRGHVRKCKTCPIKLIATACFVQLPSSLSSEGGPSQSTDELD